MNKKVMSILLVVVLCITMAAFVFAAEGTDAGSAAGTTVTAPENGTGTGGTTVVDDKVTYEELQVDREGTKNKGKDAEKVKTNNSDSEKKVIKLQDQEGIEKLSKLKDLEKVRAELEAKYKEALRQQGENLSPELKEQLRVMKEELKKQKAEINEARKQLREMVRASYTEQELEEIAEVEKELKAKYPNDKILPIDSIVPHGFSFKFDTPPVIREGRTLVPVRALTEGLGATVAKTTAVKTTATTMQKLVKS